MSDAIRLIIPPDAEIEPKDEEPAQIPVSRINCTKCLFFRELAKHPTPQGSCHRIPPVPQIVGQRPHPLGGKYGTQPVAMSFWPSVGIQDWCGEFQQQLKKPEDRQ